MPQFSGASTAATGTITSNTASLLSFLDSKRYVLISNQSGQKCYCKINDAASPTVSATVYDFVLADGGTFAIDDVDVTNIAVYVTATSGVRVVGWD